MFAFIGSGESVGLKCGRDRADADELVQLYPGDVSASAYIGRFRWSGVEVGVRGPDDELRELIDISYDAIVSKLPESERPPG
ncbi:hypothetical protein GLP40_10365 [Nocardia sp. CT2-14]|uniref:MmcQ/YjbR family DNA-binding protein n=1 Tax=Nocardia aurantiaca TaxID=2675850 RepID=A0A6I3L014_9NOCA|nr:hypothetical protein [Nocardia aurantiaca]